MKLAAKLVLLFLCCLALVVSVFSYLSVKQAKDLALAEHERHATDLAATLQAALRNSPYSTSEIQRTLTTWSREVQHVQVRLVNPHHDGDLSLSPAVPAELVITARETTTFIYPDRSGQNTMYTYVPLEDVADSQLEVAAPESFWSERLSRSLRSSAIALVAVSLATSLVILLGGLWMVGNPLETLVEKVQRVGQGDLSQPVNLRRQDELGRLGQALNDMCGQLEQQRLRIVSETEQRIAAVEQLRHADRLRTVGRLAAGLAHEIGTPLNVVSGRAELIAGGMLSSDDIQASARTIKAQSQRIATIVQELLNFARRKSPDRAMVNLNELMRETIQLLQPIATRQKIDMQWTAYIEPAQANVDYSQLQQVFSNLLVNAIHASEDTQDRPKQIHVEIHHERGRLPPPDVGGEQVDFWRITIADNGCGMSAEIIDSIFEPFFTTKDVGEGTGLGLSIAYGIVREHGGWIEVTSQLGVGSTFAVYLPSRPLDDRSNV